MNENTHKTMQDRTPEDILCAKCAMVLVPASRIHAYRERDIVKIIHAHKCVPAMESKKDFEQEVR